MTKAEIKLIWATVVDYWCGDLPDSERADLLVKLESIVTSEQFVSVFDGVLPLGSSPDHKQEKAKASEALEREWYSHAVERFGHPPEEKILMQLSDFRLSELRDLSKNCMKFQVSADEDKRRRGKLYRAAINLEYELRGEYLTTDPDGYFEWPNTDLDNILTPSGGLLDLPKEGPLGWHDYHVGIHHGKEEHERRNILTLVFESAIPPAWDIEYVTDWGAPKSSRRLEKMAWSLAMFAKDKKKRNSDSRYDEAIREWEKDLKYLYKKYYVDHFKFDWPNNN